MHKLKLFILFVASYLMVWPAHAGNNVAVPEIGAGGALAAVTIVSAIAAIIVERRRM